MSTRGGCVGERIAERSELEVEVVVLLVNVFVLGWWLLVALVLTVPVLNDPLSVVLCLSLNVETGNIQWPDLPFFILNLRVPGGVLIS